MIIKFLSYVADLKHNEEPDYEFLRKLFKTELKNLGCSESDKLVFKVSNIKSASKIKKGSRESLRTKEKKLKLDNGHISSEEDENLVEEPIVKKRKPTIKKDNAMSWKDCPTAKASNVVKAGEYNGKITNGDVGEKPEVATKRPQRKVK